MNAKSLLLIVFAALPLPALASPPPAAMITVDCNNPVWPTLRQVATHVGYDAFNPAYRIRKQLMLDGRRACRHGAMRVDLVLQRESSGLAPMLTRIDKPR